MDMVVLPMMALRSWVFRLVLQGRTESTRTLVDFYRSNTAVGSAVRGRSGFAAQGLWPPCASGTTEAKAGIWRSRPKPNGHWRDSFQHERRSIVSG